MFEEEFEIGDYVMDRAGWTGYVEDVDYGEGRTFVDVRLQTPDNEPSVLVSCYDSNDLMKVPDTVLPPAKDEKWKAEAESFYRAITEGLSELLGGNDDDE